MTDPTGPPAADYPAPPWKARGVLWMSVLTAREAPELPADLSPVGGRRTLLLVLARYTEGSLRYDEFAVGSLARRGRRVGLFCHRIWVDSAASLRGGRRLWGIPKELARFSWDAETVRIRDDNGPVAALRLGPHGRARIPVLRAPSSGFGRIGGERTFLCGQVSGRLGRGRLGVLDWHPPLPGLAAPAPRCTLSVSSARFVFPAGTRLGPAGSHAPGRTGA